MDNKEFVFKNNGDRIFNDVIDNEVFELFDYSYTFILKPKTKYWRFGIKLSKDQHFEFLPNARHQRADQPDIHIGVGTPKDNVSWQWNHPNHLHLVHYHLPEYNNHTLYDCVTFKSLSEVEWRIINKNGRTHIVFNGESCLTFNKEIVIPEEYKYFKIYAWADKIAFEIDCKVVKVSTLIKPIRLNTVVKELNVGILTLIDYLNENGIAIEPKPTARISESEYEMLKRAFKQNLNKEGNYWLIKFDPEVWPIDQLSIGKEYLFTTYDFRLKRRPEYHLFSKVKKDDKVIGYASNQMNSIVCVFRISRKINRNSTLGEVINLKVTELIKPSIPLNLFQKTLSHSVEGNNISLFSLTGAEYDSLLQTLVLPQFDSLLLPSYSSDTIDGTFKDQLNFEPDINALASVIAYKEVKPPLAIGLFGNWGYGKSFFMRNLQKRIEYLSHVKNTPFCEKVVHVSFNSWHYSDANLWASLITKIFEELNSNCNKESLKKLYENLSSTKELIEEANLTLDRIQKEKEQINEQIREKEKEVKEKVEHLNSLKAKDILTAVWNNGSVQGQVKTIRNLLPEETIEDINDIRFKTIELSSFGNKIIEIIKQIYWFRKGKKIFILLSYILTLIAIYSIVTIYANTTLFAIDWISNKISLILLVLTQLTFFVRPAYANVQNGYKLLISLQETCKRLEVKEQEIYNKELADITEQLEQKKEEENRLMAEQDNLTIQKRQLEYDIEDITSGRKLHKFIQDKVMDKRYVDGLGIISWIRKDFEELDFLLKLQHESETSLDKKIDLGFKIDRIVLYIDDLDRCDESTVVKVLQAIHLLLAFPLFVVVVGVDQRWVHKAITSTYKRFLNNEENMSEFTGATSYDYLEKIFQIPFMLKALDNLGKRNLIRAQLGANIINDSLQTINVDIEDNVKITEHSQIESANNLIEAEKINLRDSNGDDDIIDTPKPPSISITPNENAILTEITPDLLKITQEEIVFMQNISEIIGDSPRTINRYINIYRIIRTHSDLDIDEQDYFKDYCACMVVLAIITGMPKVANDIFISMKSYAENTIFEVFLQTETETDFKRLISVLTTPVNNLALGQIELKYFLKNLSLISRFSFKHN